MTLLRGVNHVALATGDLEALIDFYTEVFDASAERLPGGHAFIRIGPATVLHAFERPAPDVDVAPWRHGPIDHLALEAADVDAFMTARDRLVGRGVAAEDVTDFGALVSLRFTDPDGLRHELALWKPEPEWMAPFETVPFRGRAGGGAAGDRR